MDGVAKPRVNEGRSYCSARPACRAAPMRRPYLRALGGVAGVGRSTTREGALVGAGWSGLCEFGKPPCLVVVLPPALMCVGGFGGESFWNGGWGLAGSGTCASIIISSQRHRSRILESLHSRFLTPSFLHNTSSAPPSSSPHRQHSGVHHLGLPGTDYLNP